MERFVNKDMLMQFRNKLMENERSLTTIKKYLADVGRFMDFVGEGNTVDKETLIRFKCALLEKYAPVSVNSILAALNCFFKELGWGDYALKSVKIQKDSFRDKKREISRQEYLRLVKTAEKRGNKRLSNVMQTIASTGIRISELQFITVEALQDGYAVVLLKGKTRKVLLTSELCRKLRKYAKEQQIVSGAIFITRSGKALDRTNVLHEMKLLCTEAGVDRDKVFPHNLRHLFACLYYDTVKDIVRLADILGHSSVNTTRIYTSISGREQQHQIERLRLII